MENNKFLAAEVPKHKILRSHYTFHEALTSIPCKGDHKDCFEQYERDDSLRQDDVNPVHIRTCFNDFSSGDDCLGSYELKMERTIVEQNGTIQHLQEDVEKKDNIIKELEDELKKNIAVAQEVVSLKIEIDELHQHIEKQELCLKERSEQLFASNEIKKKLESDCNTNLKKIQDELRIHYEKETEKLNSQNATNLKLVIEKCGLKEAFLEKQIELLFNRIQELNERGHVHDMELEASRKIYEEEFNEIKLALGHLSEMSIITDSDSPSVQIKALNDKLASSLSTELTLKKELKSQLSDLEKLQEKFKILNNDYNELVVSKQLLFEQCKTFEYERNKVKEENSILEGKCQNFQYQIEKLSQENSQLQEKCQNCEYQISKLKQENSLLQEKCKAFEYEINNINEENSHLLKKCENVEYKTNQFTQENLLLQNQLSQANAHAEELNKQYNKNLLELDLKKEEIVKNYNSDLENLSKALEDLYNIIINILPAAEKKDPNNFEPDRHHYLEFYYFNDQNFYNVNFTDAIKIIKNAFNASLQVDGVIRRVYNDYNKLFEKNKNLKLIIDKTCKESEEQTKLYEDELTTIKNNYLIAEADNCKLSDKLEKMETEYSRLKNDFDKLSLEALELKKLLEEYTVERNNFFGRFQTVCLSPIKQESTDENVTVVSEIQCNYTTPISKEVESAVENNFVTSTPFHGPCDTAGGGEMIKLNQNKSKTDLRLSLMKWMERCHHLDKENKTLLNKVESLQFHISELEMKAQLVKEEMDIFEEKRQNLDNRLSKYTTIKNQCSEVLEQNALNEIKISNLCSELEYLQKENNQLLKKNGCLEDKVNDFICELKNVRTQEGSAFNETIMNKYNDKIQEIILLKGEINSLECTKNQLTHRMDLLVNSNNLYIIKFEEITKDLQKCRRELEEMRCGKLEGDSSNRLMSKELEILKLRINYLSNLREDRWCPSGCLAIIEEMHNEVLDIYRNGVESKSNLVDSMAANDKKYSFDDEDKELDARHLADILSKLNYQLQTEKEDLSRRLDDLNKLICSKGSTIDDIWLVQIDKMQRNMFEEMKYHKEQYNRIEEALRSTGNLHDELQKQKDEIRVKIHEMTNVHKKLEEEKLTTKKLELKLKHLQQEIKDKNEIIEDSASTKKNLVDENSKLKTIESQFKLLQEDLEEKIDIIEKTSAQRNMFENDLKELQKQLEVSERRHELDIKDAEWKLKEAELKISQKEIEKTMETILENDNTLEGSHSCESHESMLRDVEKTYQEAVQQVQYYLNAEFSASSAKSQEEHTEQIQKLQNIIYQQAIKIDILTTKISSDTDSPTQEGCGSGMKELNIEHGKQYELAVCVLRQLHKEDLQLLRLQLEAEKYSEVYRIIYKNPAKNKQFVLVGDLETLDFKLRIDAYAPENVMGILRKVLLNEYITRIQKCMPHWQNMYINQLLKLKENLMCNLKECQKNIENYENFKILIEANDNLMEQQQKLISFAQEFLDGLIGERKSIFNELNNYIGNFNQKTCDIFEKLKVDHELKNDFLALQNELSQLKKEKEELEKRHKTAIELLQSDHSVQETKIQNLLQELKQCCQRGFDSKTLEKIKHELETKHRKEVDELRIYFEQKCSDMEKQFSEEMVSQHSRKMSLSSSCSEEGLSEQLLYDRGAGGDNNHSLTFIEAEPIVENMSIEQAKLAKELNSKWSEIVKEMKNSLEIKYTRKLKEIQEQWKNFAYNNELEIKVKCINDEVLRECKGEIEFLEKDLTHSNRIVEPHDDFDSIQSDSMYLISSKVPLKVDWAEREAAWEEILVDEMGGSVTRETLNKIKNEFIMAALFKANLEKETKFKISELSNCLNINLLKIEDKLKMKEDQLIGLHNKFNTYSHSLLRIFDNVNKINHKLKDGIFIENINVIERLLEEDKNDKWPKELQKMKEIVDNNYNKLLEADKRDYEIELERVKTEYEQKIESNFENQFSSEEMERVMRERDNLKQLTSTLKSAVNQLVSYLSCCEDELNKTVVDELVKICHESPRKQDDISTPFQKYLPTTDSEAGMPLAPRRVHFAPDLSRLLTEFSGTSLSEIMDGSHDASAVFRAELESCLKKLKLEAAALLNLTVGPAQIHDDSIQMVETVGELQKQNNDLLREVTDLKSRLEKQQNESIELLQKMSEDIKQESSTFLQDKAQQLLTEAQTQSFDLSKVVDELAKTGDQLIYDLQKEKIDLQQQVEAADKQLKATRRFLEEQAVERETERDEYFKEVTLLQSRLKERGKTLASQERYSSQLEELEVQLKDVNVLLKDTEEKKDKVETELKEAIDKIWVLRDIIKDLEGQLGTKSEKEALLEKKLDELEAELDQQNGTQTAMAQELESLRSQSLEENYLEQIQQLQENIKIQFNSTVVRQIKSQLREMDRTLELRTKELESLHLNASCNSLSSPSEEISVREQLEWVRSKTPDQCPSPVGLPVEEVSRLQEKLHRHTRAEEMLIKRLKDTQLTIVKFKVELEEMLAEREVLQQQFKKQMNQLAEANNKIDDLRHKVIAAETNTNRDLVLQIQKLKEKSARIEQELETTQNQLLDHKNQLSLAEEIIKKQTLDIRNLSRCDHDALDTLRLQLASVTADRNKLEEQLDKYRRDNNMDVMSAILADKNEDIEQLQKTVAFLQNQDEDEGEIEKQGSCNSKGFRVSFAADMENSTELTEDQLRDAPQPHSFEVIPSRNIESEIGCISPIQRNFEEKLIEPSIQFSMPGSILNSGEESEDLKKELDEVKLELSKKQFRVESLEKEVDFLRSVEVDLKNTKTELENVVTSVMEDKKYYETELKTMSTNLMNKVEELQSIQKLLSYKDEEIMKTSADVQTLREISGSLQEKLREATELLEKETSNNLKDELESLRAENSLLKTESQQLRDLELEIQSYKNDFADLKELCETLKSSLNLITNEKQCLDKEIFSLKEKNKELLYDLRNAQKNLDSYVSEVRNVKNDLFNKQNLDNNKSDSFSNENEIMKLQNEITKLISSNGQLQYENNEIQKELNQIKATLKSQDIKSISSLQDDIAQYQKIVHNLKEENGKIFYNFDLEINKLQKDISIIQMSRDQAIQKLKGELLERENLQNKYSNLEDLLDRERMCRLEERSQQLERKLNRLSVVDNVHFVDIPPDSSTIVDNSREKVSVSTSFEVSLLESLNSKSNECPSSPCSHLNSQGSCKFYKSYGNLLEKVRSLERGLLLEMESLKEVRSTLREKEAKCRELETKAAELEFLNAKLHRLSNSQEQRISHLLEQIEDKKNKVLTLELDVAKEKAHLKEITVLYEEEKSKARSSQKDDINLIENMRERIKNLMENEMKLRQLAVDERQKSDHYLAQLNSLKAIEKYRSDSDDGKQSSVKKSLLQEREKCLALRVECEKERRICEDLREILARERTALCLMRNNLQKVERNKTVVEKEISILKQQLSEETIKREMAESKVYSSRETEELRFQQQIQAIEHRNKKSLDAAYAVIREIEQEYSDLKKYLRTQQDQDEKWKENVHVPLIQQLNEVNENFDTLIVERVELKKTVEKLNRENTRMENIIRNLEQLPRRITPSPLEVPDLRLVTEVPEEHLIVDTNADSMILRLLRADKMRKALVWQKRYLEVVLKGYEETNKKFFDQYLQNHHIWPNKKKSFRCVALAVRASIRLMKLKNNRLNHYKKNKDLLLNAVKNCLGWCAGAASGLPPSMPIDRLTSPPRRAPPHSPPCRERRSHLR